MFSFFSYNNKLCTNNFFSPRHLIEFDSKETLSGRCFFSRFRLKLKSDSLSTSGQAMNGYARTPDMVEQK